MENTEDIKNKIELIELYTFKFTKLFEGLVEGHSKMMKLRKKHQDEELENLKKLLDKYR